SAACKTFPRRIAFCPYPASASAPGKDCGEIACRTSDRTNPGECDPQPMCTSFVAQQWHMRRHFVAPRQHSVNNRRARAWHEDPSSRESAQIFRVAKAHPESHAERVKTPLATRRTGLRPRASSKDAEPTRQPCDASA